MPEVEDATTLTKRRLSEIVSMVLCRVLPSVEADGRHSPGRWIRQWQRFRHQIKLIEGLEDQVENVDVQVFIVNGMENFRIPKRSLRFTEPRHIFYPEVFAFPPFRSPVMLGRHSYL